MFVALLIRMGISSRLSGFLAPLILVMGMIAGVLGFGAYREHAGLVAGRAEIQAKLDGYRAQVGEASRLADISRGLLDVAQKDTVLKLKSKLTELEDRRPIIETHIKKVKEYVTVKADSQCSVPDGAVWLLDLPSESERGHPAIPGSGPEDVDSPSGIALSRVVETTARNLQECAERGTLIKTWQDWYGKNVADWNDFRAKLPAKVTIPK
jgi:hypothetical protein